MSQYPPPPPQDSSPLYYQPQYIPVSQAAFPPGSKACRTAAIVQMIIGGLGMLMAVCVGALFAMIAGNVIPVEDQAELAEVAQELPVSLSTLLLIVTICMGVPALALVVLGIFIWRESRVAIVLSLVLAAGLAVLNVVGTVAQAATQGADVSLCSNLFSTLVLASLAALHVWALRDLSARGAVSRNLYAQWQQYYAAQQQQQQTPSAPPPPPGDEPLPPPPMPPSP